MIISGRVVFAVIALTVSGLTGFGQDALTYRTYRLSSTLDAVVATSGARATDVKTIHERPAKIQELEWRAPYRSSGSEPADPVRQIVFTFVDDALYQLVVTYDRDKTEGLTNRDIIDTVRAAYGAPVPRSTRPAGVEPDTMVLGQWDAGESSLTLVRGTYAPEFQLILISKPLSLRARNAIRVATRLDEVEAPRREADQRKKEAAAAIAARDKARATNKAAFRP